ncbi:MAG: ASKHA domain-containing protein [Anaerolineae bacterium]|nr:ASKHA domain-containing protein [Anaerolineae bacterium]
MSEASTNHRRHQLILMPSGRRGDVAHADTLLDAARQLGVELESICGGRQTCGKCLVAPEFGQFPKHHITSAPEHLSPPDADEQIYAEKHGLDLSRERLACAVHLLGDALLHIPESSLARKQVVRKEAGDLAIDLKPAVQMVYVAVPPAELGGRGDWPRLKAALAEQWNLPDLTIDPHLLPHIQTTLRETNGAVTATIWHNREVIRLEPGYAESLYGLAIDIGSTTLAGHLCDLRTGAVIATETMMNPQVRYGEDLISRISYATEPQGMSRMHHAIVRAINDLSKNAAEAAGIAPHEITDMVLVGNTVMHHLMLGINPVEIGHLPFALATDDALDLQARDLGFKTIHEGARVHLLPCVAGYVGADNVAVLLAEYPHLDEGITLVVDIGTNAEILLCQGERILSASSPTGPAFEGAQITHGQRAAAGAIERVRIVDGGVRYKVVGDARWNDELNEGESLRPTGICGSGIIEIVAELFTAGLISGHGKFVEDAADRSDRIRLHGRLGEFVLAAADESATGSEIVITQKDIRAIQLAKAALYSGVRLLMDHLGIQAVDRIRLAGAFGSYIDPLYAMRIGLIPDCALDRVTAVGNAAGDGARIALLNVDQRQMIQDLVRRVEYVETAAESNFQEYFVDALLLPHAVDAFPHLDQIGGWE